MGRRLSGLTIAAAIVLMSGSAWGSASYPMLIQQHLGLSCQMLPTCTICHNSLNGGTGTANTPFVRTLKGLGLIAESPASLQRALDQDKAQHIDSDGDGDTDIDALIGCKDPNQSNVAVGDGAVPPTAASAPMDPTPEYGCTIGRTAGGNGVVAAIVLGVALAVRRRGRCPSRRKG